MNHWQRTAMLAPLLLRQGLARALAYRLSAVLTMIFGSLFAVAEIVGVLVYFRFTDAVAGWDEAAFLTLVATAGLIQNGYQLLFVVSHEELMGKILEGSLDYDLIRPVDAQLLANAQKIDLPSMANLLIPLALLVHSWPRLSPSPTGLAALGYAALVVVGLAFYAVLNQLFVGCSFWIERPVGLTGVPEYLLEMGRRPAAVYPRSLQFVLSGAVPILVATNLPVEVLRGHGEPRLLGVLLVATVGLAVLARWQWRAGLRRYSSAN